MMFGQMFAQLPAGFIILPVLAFLISGAIVLCSPMVPAFYGRAYNLNAVQAMHKRPTSRVGGVAIAGCLLVGEVGFQGNLFGPFGAIIWPMCILFAAGLLEDLGVGVSPTGRLLAACLASAAAIVLFDAWLPRAGIPLLDPLMQYWALGVPLTILVTVGISNGFNLIDGVNGLAGFTAIFSAIALGFIALNAGVAPLAYLCFSIAVITAGFLILNFPFGLIFLGDGGAYILGFLLSWCGVLILVAAPTVSAWAILMTAFWPVADTLLAIYRRALRKSDKMAPDRRHIHQLVLRLLELKLIGTSRRTVANPMSALVLAPLIAVPPLTAVFLWDKNGLAALAIVVFAGLFFGIYTLLVRRLKTRRSGHSVRRTLS